MQQSAVTSNKTRGERTTTSAMYSVRVPTPERGNEENEAWRGKRRKTCNLKPYT